MTTCLFCRVYLGLTYFGIRIASVLTGIIEKSERVHDTHKYETKSDKTYDKYGSSGSEVFLRPVPPSRPTVDDFSVLEDTETHADSEECVKYFYEKHNLYLLGVIYLKTSFHVVNS